MPRNTKWTKAEKIALIIEFRKRPILWQRSFRESKYTSAKAKAWCEIANKLRFPVRECQQKMLSCKAVYRKVRGLVRNGREGEVIRRESWFGYELMKFLEQNVYKSEENGSPRTELHTDSSSEAGMVEDSSERQTACVYVKHEAFDEEDLISVGEPSIGVADGLVDQDEKDDRVEQGASIFSTSLGQIGPNEVKHLQRPSSLMRVENERLDDKSSFDAFGQYVAAELGNMPRRAAILLQQQLHQCIIEAKLQAVGP